uniref:Neur_chan_LBD domain-containing protein n=1 Tax=Heterorhabditis bacteriophora TaxID=37862 RepID=A0A1I7XA31_HETBA
MSLKGTQLCDKEMEIQTRQIEYNYLLMDPTILNHDIAFTVPEGETSITHVKCRFSIRNRTLLDPRDAIHIVSTVYVWLIIFIIANQVRTQHPEDNHIKAPIVFSVPTIIAEMR